MEDGLDEHVVTTGLDRSDDVDNLCDVGDLHHVCVADKAVQETSHDQCVFEVVTLFDQMRRNLVRTLHLHVLVPDIPFVETQQHATAMAMFRLDIAT